MPRRVPFCPGEKTIVTADSRLTLRLRMRLFGVIAVVALASAACGASTPARVVTYAPKSGPRPSIPVALSGGTVWYNDENLTVVIPFDTFSHTFAKPIPDPTAIPNGASPRLRGSSAVGAVLCERSGREPMGRWHCRKALGKVRRRFDDCDSQARSQRLDACISRPRRLYCRQCDVRRTEPSAVVDVVDKTRNAACSAQSRRRCNRAIHHAAWPGARGVCGSRSDQRGRHD